MTFRPVAGLERSRRSVRLAAIAAGVAPGNYAQQDAAQKGLAGIRKYLSENPPPTLHHRAMILWASSYLDGLLTDEQKRVCVDELLAIQKNDGGWGLATLGDWKRFDGKQQDRESSDGYGTGFVVYVLRQSGVSADSKGSKIVSRMCSGTPGPVSVTAISKAPSGVRLAWRVTEPPSGVQRSAFSRRLATICRMRIFVPTASIVMPIPTSFHHRRL